MSIMSKRMSFKVALQLMLLVTSTTLASSSNPQTTSSNSPPIALPGCQDHCGSTPIPYPFGIGPNCSHNSPWFQITCNASHPNSPVPYSTNLTWQDPWFQSPLLPPIPPVQILAVDLLQNSLQISGSYDSYGSYYSPADLTPMKQLDMRGSPFVLMTARNSLLVSGCGGSVVLRDYSHGIVGGCSTVCADQSLIQAYGVFVNRSCYGIGCCQTEIDTTSGVDYFRMEYLATLNAALNSSDKIMAAVVDNSYIPANRSSLYGSFLEDPRIPTVLEWTVPDLPIDSAQYSNSVCEMNVKPRGYSCKCKFEYFRGNPYLPNGCQVVKECEECPNACVSTGAGNNATAYRCPQKPAKSVMPIALGLGISLGTLMLSIVVYGLYRLLKERKEIMQKQNNFKRNGGMLLHQQMSTSKCAIERTKLFTSNELERATDNFNENRILGRGGQGVVYKGMLVDGTIVAIKKSTKVNETQLEQFINEVVILSQVNHRNVVKLFGCCLETEVPLLVYEFVPNGTLFEQIHKPSEDFRITWKMRLQIAAQSAEALAYLHSSSYAPIYHRDIKTSNILLDDKYKAKVSDFGTSKTIAIDQTHVSTCVQGTFGYIDPEFFQSNQFTEKSDVYSFGIVLVELLTSMKPINPDRTLDSRGLAFNFLHAMQNSGLYDIVDGKVLEEVQKEELEGVASLAQQCLKLNGKERPTMKEVATTLLMIISQHCELDPSLKQSFCGKRDLVANCNSMEVFGCSLSTDLSTYTSSEDPSSINE